MKLKNNLKRIILNSLWFVKPDFFKKHFKFYGQIFSIGIFNGENPLSLFDDSSYMNPVITADDIDDVPAAFVADPFIILKNNEWFMFFEVYNRIKKKGEIGLATSSNGKLWNYNKIILNEAFHLSYPYVFKWCRNYYMIPESSEMGVRLYQAKNFPYNWQFIKTIINSKGLVDNTIFFFNSLFWLFSSIDSDEIENKKLFLYYAKKPTGAWIKHPQDPIINEKTSLTRCAGRVIDYDGKLIRFAQIGIPSYGTGVKAYEILKINTMEYHEKEIDSAMLFNIFPAMWNKNGMHHLDLLKLEDKKWIACVDGWYNKNRSQLNI